MKHLLPISIAAVLIFAAGLTVTQSLQGKDAAPPSSDLAVVDKLREIVAIRQKLVESNKRALQNGQGARDGRYELALAEDRLNLARELGQRNEQIAALRDILKVQQSRLDDAKKLVAVEAMAPDDAETNRVAVLEAEVRLLRAQKSLSQP